ncbi:unnamed protein product [Diamesa serratosioi]
MKLFIGIILSLVVASQSAAISNVNAPLFVKPDELFITANDFQNKLTSLQQDINLQLTAIRTSVSNVLRSSSSQTLAQIENNSIAILEQDAPVREIVFALESTSCTNNLRSLLNGFTEFSGFPSSTCVARYDDSVQSALKAAYALLEKYEGIFSEVQQIVVKSFIRQNAFLTPDAIIETIQNQYEIRAQEWEKIRPDIESFVKSLAGNVAVFNAVLESCFANVQTSLTPSYNLLLSEVAVCKEFDNTRTPFAKLATPVATNFLMLEDILPKFE